MVDLTITAANVLASGQAVKETGVAGATITAGQTVYKEAGTGLFKLSDSNDAVVEKKAVYGIALHGSLTGQPLTIVRSDPAFIPGATMTLGTAYYLSETPGGIQPVADLGAGEQIVLLGIATSTTVLNLQPFNPGASL
jgi:hypothetical protein